MAQIEQSDKGKKKKGAQKKIAIHVDFTPMVDMNMLLITFFMLCTTMLKSQTVQLVLPAKPDPNMKKEDMTQAKKEDVMTLILDTQYDDKNQPLKDENGKIVHDVYYYFGDVADTILPVNPTELYHESYIAEADANGDVQGIRKVIRKKNDKVMDKYDKLKERYNNKEISDEEFEQQTLEITKDTLNKPAVVIIKALPNATYENVIYAFDELDFNKVTKYSFEEVNAGDSALIRRYEKANPGTKILRPSVRSKKK